MLPIFQSRPDRAELYLRIDTHFAQPGHQVVAQELATFLDRGGWLKR